MKGSRFGGECSHRRVSGVQQLMALSDALVSVDDPGDCCPVTGDVDCHRQQRTIGRNRRRFVALRRTI